MKILIIKQLFFPEHDLKGYPFGKELTRQGHSVQIITGFPSYPGGKVYDGYKIKLLQRENVEGIDVIRIPIYPSHDNSGFKRTITYLSYSFFATFIGLFFARKADVMYVYHPPPTVSIPAIINKFFRKIPIVSDVQDLWPDTLRSTGMVNSEVVIKIVGRYMNFVYKNSDKIIAQSPGFKERLVKRGIDSNKIKVIYNWSHEIITESKEENQCTDLNDIFNFEFNLLYAGNLGKAQALDSIINVAELAQNENQSIGIIFVGNGIESGHLKNLTNKKRIKNIHFINRVPVYQIADYMKKSSALLVHLRKDELFKITIPAKIQSYLRIGKPIVACLEGDPANLISKAECGVICEPENQIDIYEKVKYLKNLSDEQLDKMGENGKAYYYKNLSIEQGTQSILEVFNSLRK